MTAQDKFKRLRPERVKDIERRSKLRRKYGLTPEDKETIALRQNYRCAICPALACSEKRGLFIDHSHTTGKVRGLLCNSCNRGLGYFRDNPEFLKRAEEYLRGHS